MIRGTHESAAETGWWPSTPGTITLAPRPLKLGKALSSVPCGSAGAGLQTDSDGTASSHLTAQKSGSEAKGMAWDFPETFRPIHSEGLGPSEVQFRHRLAVPANSGTGRERKHNSLA